MSRASIHFTDSIPLCVTGSHQLPPVNNSFQRERGPAGIFIWKTICHGLLQYEVKKGQALCLQNDTVQSHTLPHCFHLGLFLPTRPPE